MEKTELKRIELAIDRFIKWLDSYGDNSYDFHTLYASKITGAAKELYYKKPKIGIFAVAPMVFCEAFLPSAKPVFYKKQRFPIADAHYSMGFSYLYKIYKKDEYYKKAKYYIDVLEKTRCPGYQYYCWGYPYDWVTKKGTIKKNTPLITTTPYVYEAFEQLYSIDKNEKWINIMRSIAKHVFNDINDLKISENSWSCSYTPFDKEKVINANAYRAFLLTSAYKYFLEDKYLEKAKRNINFILENQNTDGSWNYSADGSNEFIDHFHTCFVLKALIKINSLINHRGCSEAIENGLRYYLKYLFYDNGLPKPFSKSERITVYKSELYNYAECINLFVLSRNNNSIIVEWLQKIIEELIKKWQKKDGSFRSRKLLIGWDNLPMHRWAQAQLFRAMSYLIYSEKCNTL